MGTFPTSSDLCIHFAHSAYRLSERFAERGTSIKHFQTWTPEDTHQRIAEGHVLVASGFWQNSLLESAMALRFIQVCAVGYDQFDRSAIAARGVRLANAAGVNANAVSDHALALILGLTRQLHYSRDNQRRRYWRPMISNISSREDELPGKVLLIYGTGQIGGRIAKLAKAFGLVVWGIRRDVSKSDPNIDELHAPSEFLSLLPRADVVVLACPLTNETRGLMDQDAFSAMRESAFFINVARGGCADHDALVAALKDGQIAGAGIDVTDPEPLQSKSALWDLDNVILTPHTGGETRRYEDNVIDVLLDNLKRLQMGQAELRNQIA
ncbi:MAG: D-2-hydroxyacid dehydrogenase [Hyphomicrobiaceae bacterium]